MCHQKAEKEMPMRPTKKAAAVLAAVLLMVCCAYAGTAEWNVAKSLDGVPIAYSVQGKGKTTLVFVHGWSCDSRYWRGQVPYFEKKYRVVTLDLAGHGHSGLGRETYTVQAFGRDVKAAVEKSGAERVILIGHSMGGEIVAEAARLMPGRVIGIIGVDTLQSVEYRLSREELDKLLADFNNDFVNAAEAFIRTMITKDADKVLVEWVLADMSSTPKQAAISTISEYMGMYVAGKTPELFDAIKVPVRCVNTDMWPTDIEGNRRHMKSFDVFIMKGAGHFLMLERPKEFNKLLEKAIQSVEGE
jgi:pimeloyl-ACP methyl ester carboxylesterase